MSSWGGLLPWKSSMFFHAGFEVFVLLLDFFKALVQLYIFLCLLIKQREFKKASLSSFACLVSILRLTSLSISMSFFSCWCSCWILISSTTLRLSSSCSRYRVWGSFCGWREGNCLGFVTIVNPWIQTTHRGRHASQNIHCFGPTSWWQKRVNETENYLLLSSTFYA